MTPILTPCASKPCAKACALCGCRALKTGRRPYHLRRSTPRCSSIDQISITFYSAYCSVSAQAWPGLMHPLPTRLNSPHATNPAPEQINSTAPPGSSKDGTASSDGAESGQGAESSQGALSNGKAASETPAAPPVAEQAESANSQTLAASETPAAINPAEATKPAAASPSPATNLAAPLSAESARRFSGQGKAVPP